MELNLPIHTYQLRSRPASPARLVNCMPEQVPPDAQKNAVPAILIRAPGVKAWTTVGDGPIRGMYAAHIELTTGHIEYLYVVSGQKLYYVDTAKAVTEIGTVGGGGRIDIDSNLNWVVVVNEPDGYSWRGTHTGTHTGANNVGGTDTEGIMEDSAASFPPGKLVGETISNTTDLSAGIITANTETTVTVILANGTGDDWDTSDAYTINTFAKIADDDFISRGAGDVEFLDDFMIFREPDSARFFIAEYGSTSDFDALQFAIADSSTDDLVGMIEDHRQLLLFGTKSLELWENTGAFGVPFERNINGVIPKGCLNAATIAAVDYSVYWVAEDNTVRRLDGLTPMVVSTHAVEQFIAAATASTLEAFTYDQEGHFFYVLTADEGTFVLDLRTSEWHERETYAKNNWQPRQYAQFAGKELVGDSNSNKIGEIDPDTFADWGGIQRMEWTYQTVYAKGQRAFHNRLEIVMETGVGLTTGQGSAPKIMLQYSDDGGKTWQAMPDKDLGALGDRDVRAVWWNLGSARQRVYRAAVSDPIAITVLDTILEVDGGRL